MSAKTQDPIALFTKWFDEAKARETHNPDAMCVSTAGKDGKVSSRMILLKGFDENGFVFYTNTLSSKGGQLEENPNAALCFYWKTLDKQVRVEGGTEVVSDEESDAYFASRPRDSQIGAWASQQSHAMTHPDDLKNALAEYTKKFDGRHTVPRPPHWKGFRVKPEYFEFWAEKPHRLHERKVFTRDGDGWRVEILYP